MPSDFIRRGTAAYSALPAPAVPLEAIHRRAGRRVIRERVLVACAALLVAGGTVGFAGGAAAEATKAIRLWLGHGSANIDVRAMTVVSYPRVADMRDAIRRATFPVVLPELPAGARVRRLMFAPSDRPTTITLSYDAGGASIGVTLADPASIETSTPPAGAPSKPIAVDRAGGEVVITKEPLADGVRSAILAASPDSALAADEPAFTTAIALANDVPRIAAAALDADAVLIGPSQLTRIATLAQRGEPLRDARIAVLTDIPRVNNEPDYTHAKLQFSRAVVLPPSAVREVAHYVAAHPAIGRRGVRYDRTAAAGARIAPL